MMNMVWDLPPIITIVTLNFKLLKEIRLSYSSRSESLLSVSNKSHQIVEGDLYLSNLRMDSSRVINNDVKESDQNLKEILENFDSDKDDDFL
jgi:hypothetical protein